MLIRPPPLPEHEDSSVTPGSLKQQKTSGDILLKFAYHFQTFESGILASKEKKRKKEKFENIIPTSETVEHSHIVNCILDALKKKNLRGLLHECKLEVYCRAKTWT